MIKDDLEAFPDEFKKGWRCIMLIHRPKDGGERNEQRKSHKFISRDEVEWVVCIAKALELQEKMYPDHRVYASVNDRHPVNSIFEFRRRQLAAEQENICNHWNFYHDIQNRFFSALCRPVSRVSSWFLVDCDSYCATKQNKEVLKDLIKYEYPTKNGVHLITEPFNPADYELFKETEVHKDGMFYIG